MTKESKGSRNRVYLPESEKFKCILHLQKNPEQFNGKLTLREIARRLHTDLELSCQINANLMRRMMEMCGFEAVAANGRNNGNFKPGSNVHKLRTEFEEYRKNIDSRIKSLEENIKALSDLLMEASKK